MAASVTRSWAGAGVLLPSFSRPAASCVLTRPLTEPIEKIRRAALL